MCFATSVPHVSCFLVFSTLVSDHVMEKRTWENDDGKKRVGTSMASLLHKESDRSMSDEVAFYAAKHTTDGEIRGGGPPGVS